MEKFQKYCLSVLLVIICSNISAQVNSNSPEKEYCEELCEFYTNFLYFQISEIHYSEIHHRRDAGDIIGKTFFEKQSGKFHNSKFGNIGFYGEKDAENLENFEKTIKENSFAGTVYFKSKVSKIRNKDYLDLVS